MTLRDRFLTMAAALAVCCGSQVAFAQGVFTLSSPDFKDGERLPLKNAGNNKANPNCVGENVSPTLNWANPPAGSRPAAAKPVAAAPVLSSERRRILLEPSWRMAASPLSFPA